MEEVASGKHIDHRSWNDREVCCDLCKALGTGHDGHHREFCYCDPANKVFNKDLLEKQIRFAQAKGITVHQWILDL